MPALRFPATALTCRGGLGRVSTRMAVEALSSPVLYNGVDDNGVDDPPPPTVIASVSSGPQQSEAGPAFSVPLVVDDPRAATVPTAGKSDTTCNDAAREVNDKSTSCASEGP